MYREHYGSHSRGNEDFTAMLFAVMSEYERDLRELPPADAYEIARLEVLERLDEQIYDRHYAHECRA